MISRRQFLQGRFAPSAKAPPTDEKGQRLARIGASCAAWSNQVCRLCADACKEHAIVFSPRPMAAALPAVKTDKCTGCSDCAWVCPEGAISFVDA